MMSADYSFSAVPILGVKIGKTASALLTQRSVIFDFYVYLAGCVTVVVLSRRFSDGEPHRVGLSVLAEAGRLSPAAGDHVVPARDVPAHAEVAVKSSERCRARRVVLLDRPTGGGQLQSTLELRARQSRQLGAQQLPLVAGRLTRTRSAL